MRARAEQKDVGSVARRAARSRRPAPTPPAARQPRLERDQVHAASGGVEIRVRRADGDARSRCRQRHRDRPGEEERVFERFYRSPGAVTPGPGHGLGLFIAQASRRRTAGGSRRRIAAAAARLPARAAAQQRPVGRPRSRAGARRMSGRRSSVAEDDEDILLLVATRLKRDGFDVSRRATGTRRSRSLASGGPGRGARHRHARPRRDRGVRQIRADDELRAMQHLLLTAKAQESDVRRGFEAGADAYVRKPFSPAELSAKVPARARRRAACRPRRRIGP